MAIVYIGIGTNLGARIHNIEVAMGALDLLDQSIELLDCSSILETDPVGGPPQESYLNGVLKIRTNLRPKKLLKRLKKIERGMGRKKSVRNGPRIIDLDILLYDDIVKETKRLTIPHPRMFEREFVLIPLKQLMPQIVSHPAYANHKKF